MKNEEKNLITVFTYPALKLASASEVADYINQHTDARMAESDLDSDEAMSGIKDMLMPEFTDLCDRLSAEERIVLSVASGVYFKSHDEDVRVRLFLERSYNYEDYLLGKADDETAKKYDMPFGDHEYIAERKKVISGLAADDVDRVLKNMPLPFHFEGVKLKLNSEKSDDDELILGTVREVSLTGNLEKKLEIAKRAEELSGTLKTNRAAEIIRGRALLDRYDDDQLNVVRNAFVSTKVDADIVAEWDPKTMTAEDMKARHQALRPDFYKTRQMPPVYVASGHTSWGRRGM